MHCLLCLCSAWCPHVPGRWNLGLVVGVQWSSYHDFSSNNLVTWPQYPYDTDNHRLVPPLFVLSPLPLLSSTACPWKLGMLWPCGVQGEPSLSECGLLLALMLVWCPNCLLFEPVCFVATGSLNSRLHFGWPWWGSDIQGASGQSRCPNSSFLVWMWEGVICFGFSPTRSN